MIGILDPTVDHLLYVCIRRFHLCLFNAFLHARVPYDPARDTHGLVPGCCHLLYSVPAHRLARGVGPPLRTASRVGRYLRRETVGANLSRRDAL